MTDCADDPSGTSAENLTTAGNGVRCLSGSKIINCTFTGNRRVGIRSTGVHTYLSGNLCIKNENVGIYNLSSSCLIERNIAYGNGTSPASVFIDSDDNVVSGNFIISNTSSYGPIVNVGGVGDIKNTANSNHPFANFEY